MSNSLELDQAQHLSHIRSESKLFAKVIDRQQKMSQACKELSIVHTHYYNSNLIWRTVSRRVDEFIPSDHPRCEVLRVIQWYGLIHET